MIFENEKTYLSYDDVALMPKYSEVESRQYVNIKDEKTGLLPFIPANMACVISVPMAIELLKKNCLPILHRFGERPEDMIKEIQYACGLSYTQQIGISIGVDDKEKYLVDIRECEKRLGQRLYVCLDVAHAQSRKALDTLHFFKSKFPHLTFIAGNVASEEGTEAVINHGADIVKVGISNGSVCTTRVATGHGVPQLTCVADCAHVAEDMGKTVIADGGIKYPGDVAKALAAGASFVMIGKMFAQCKESGGVKIPSFLPDNKVQYNVEYYGSASEYNKGHNKMVEGEITYLPVKGTTSELIDRLSDGLRSALSYSGASNITEFKQRARFIRVSNAGFMEGLPHAKMGN